MRAASQLTVVVEHDAALLLVQSVSLYLTNVLKEKKIIVFVKQEKSYLEQNEIDCRHPLAICARLVRRCDVWLGAEADQQIVRRSPSQSRSHLWQWQWTTVGDRFQGRDRLKLVLVAQGHRPAWLCTR